MDQSSQRSAPIRSTLRGRASTLLCGLALLTTATQQGSAWAQVGSKPTTAAGAPAGPGAVDPGELPGLGRPPFQAWIKVGAYWPRRTIGRNALAAGVWRRGDVIKVVDCTPRCDAPRGLGLVEGGAVVPLRYLAALPMAPELARAVDFDAYRGARVIAWKAQVYAKPNLSSKKLRKERNAYLVVFVNNPDAPEGWLQRPDGGWMRQKDVKLLTASEFQGVDAPQLPLAFTIHTIRASELKGGADAATRKALQERARKKKKGVPIDQEAVDALKAMTMARHTAHAVQTVKAGRVVLSNGTELPKWKTRIAWRRERPARIGPDAMWAHVDIEQQTMVVYRGDTPLRATLVSTGKVGRLTNTQLGLYRVLSKVRMSTMRGRVPEPYLAEGVPFVMHFYQGQALHAAWWHDGFGTRRSHGCINLPPKDARWLFQETLPKVPDGWRGILLAGDDPRLTVLIEKETPKGARKVPEPTERVDARCLEVDGSRKVNCPFDAFEGNDPDAPEAAREE